MQDWPDPISGIKSAYIPLDASVACYEINSEFEARMGVVLACGSKGTKGSKNALGARPEHTKPPFGVCPVFHMTKPGLAK